MSEQLACWLMRDLTLLVCQGMNFRWVCGVLVLFDGAMQSCSSFSCQHSLGPPRQAAPGVFAPPSATSIEHDVRTFSALAQRSLCFCPCFTEAPSSHATAGSLKVLPLFLAVCTFLRAMLCVTNVSYFVGCFPPDESVLFVLITQSLFVQLPLFCYAKPHFFLCAILTVTDDSRVVFCTCGL